MGRKTLSQAEKDFMNTTLLSDFNAILDKLVITDFQRNVAVYYYFKGWKMIDIAFEFNSNEQTVSKTIREFAKKLSDYQKIISNNS